MFDLEGDDLDLMNLVSDFLYFMGQVRFVLLERWLFIFSNALSKSLFRIGSFT